MKAEMVRFRLSEAERDLENRLGMIQRRRELLDDVIEEDLEEETGFAAKGDFGFANEIKQHRARPAAKKATSHRAGSARSRRGR